MVKPEWLGIGIAILIPTVAAAWRFAGLRADMSEKWGDRIDLAKAGLSERALSVLRSMQREISDLLGIGEPFDPLDVIEDPAVLRAEAKNFLKLTRLRDRADSRYRLLLAVGPIGFVAAVAFGVGLVLVFLGLGEVIDDPWSAAGGRWLLLLAGLTLIVDVGTYAYLQHYLSAVDVESKYELE